MSASERWKATLAQCRHWQSPAVDVSGVRELFEVMKAEHAAGGIIITSGTFTPEVQSFAAGKPIDLVGLERLAAITGGG